MKFKLDGSEPSGNNYQSNTFGTNIGSAGNVAATSKANETNEATAPFKDQNIFGACGTMFIYQPTNTLYDKVVFWPQMFANEEQGTYGQTFYGAGSVEYRNSRTNALTSVILFQPPGTDAWNSGKIKVYGIS